MSQENITIDLPKSGAKAVIRSFVKNKDRKRVQRALLASKQVKDGDETEEFTISASSFVDQVEAQVRALLIGISIPIEDGNYDEVRSPYEWLEESEYEEDMEAVELAVKEVFEKATNSEKK